MNVYLFFYFLILILNQIVLTVQNKLTFSKSIYKFKISENEPISSVVGKLFLIGKVNSTTIAMNSTKTNQASEELFKLDVYTLEIKTTSRLKPSKHYFKAFILGNNKTTIISKCFIQIQVLNQTNNPPRFNQIEYQAQVFENNAPDTFVLKVKR